MKEIKRHFIVFYVVKRTDGSQEIGNLTSSRYGYISRKDIIEWVIYNDINNESVVLTNVIEVTESELASWND